MESSRLETARLVLRRWLPADVEPLAAINADPAVMRWIADGRPLDRESTAAAIERAERTWDELGFGLFAVQPTPAWSGWSASTRSATTRLSG